MSKPYSVAEAMRLSVQMSMMAVEAQTVIMLRLWGMAGLWNTADTENDRMMTEKVDAMRDASAAAGRALASGASPNGVALAALKHVRRRTRSNAARLTKRGPFA
ncbi:antifreeze protein [Paracoccaceae bacterium Fryx2]|nr:antifreeze protein [Paracoccaceae bacterium Fryx2]